jgi:hypothetical protein
VDRQTGPAVEGGVALSLATAVQGVQRQGERFS